jgi:hypothetical protein
MGTNPIAVQQNFGLTTPPVLHAVMKTFLLLAVIVAWSPAAAQTGAPAPIIPKTELSIHERIKVDRAKATAEENKHSNRPWDRDANGKRPWDRIEAPAK